MLFSRGLAKLDENGLGMLSNAVSGRDTGVRVDSKLGVNPKLDILGILLEFSESLEDKYLLNLKSLVHFFKL